MNLTLNVENATFGHVAQAGGPALDDALSTIIETASHDAAGRDRYLERVASTEHAARLFCRAYERMSAACDMAQPFIGNPYSVAFAEAANAADLLIASDLLMAMLIDRELARSSEMKTMLATVFPELFEGEYKSYELHAEGQGPEMLAILALRLHGIDATTQASLADWHGSLLDKRYNAPSGGGLLSEAGFIRDALFKSYLGREIDIEGYTLSKRSMKLGMYALAIGSTLAMRSANRRRRAQLN